MGTKGNKLTPEATATAERLVDGLAPLGDVSSKNMFGGYGVYESGVMFALVDSTGRAHLRVDQTTQPDFENAGSTKHSRMPYWSIPEPVLGQPRELLQWASRALDTARAARKM